MKSLKQTTPVSVVRFFYIYAQFGRSVQLTPLSEGGKSDAERVEKGCARERLGFHLADRLGHSCSIF